MIEFTSIFYLAKATGQDIGTSSWHKVDQDMIDKFADLTGDRQWIHIDPERTRRELGSEPIAHGYLVLSLLPCFMYEVVRVGGVKRMINYGSNKIRYLSPVSAGHRLRARVGLAAAELDGSRLRATFAVTMEIERVDKPALHAEVITLMYA